MKSARNIIQLCAGIETKLDTVLFRTREEDQQNTVPDPSVVTPGGMAKAAGVGAIGAGGLYAAGALGKLRKEGAGVIGTQSGLPVSKAVSKLARSVTTIGKGGGADIAKTVVRGANVTGAALARLRKIAGRGIQAVAARV